MSGSLGYTSFYKRVLSTSLPGSVSAPLPPVNRKITRKKKASPRSVVAVKNTPLPKQGVPLKTTTVTEVAPQESVHPAQGNKECNDDSDETQENHSLYGTLLTDELFTEEGIPAKEVSKGSRLLLAYPMRSTEEEKVLMRMKVADPVTAQLSYQWIVIYDPLSDSRYVGDFSVIP
jgi:hypothetical protein